MTARAFLNRNLARVRSALARSTPVAHAAVRLRDQLHGIVVEHLGHDIDMNRNGELWILQQLAPRCRTFIDVGANVGDWTSALLAIEPNAVGWLLEPSETAAKRLETRFCNDSRVRIVRMAASDRSGTITFFEEPNAGHTSSVTHGFSQNATARTVPVTTLDEFLEAEQIETVDYLKIDAEGHDLHVLRGAARALETCSLRAVQFEYNRPWQQAGSTLADAFALLSRADYVPFLLKGQGLYRLPYNLYGEFFHYANFVALPRERLATVAHLVGESI